jgi:hypothetical protein
MKRTEKWCLTSQPLSTIVHSRLGVTPPARPDTLWTTGSNPGMDRGRTGYEPDSRPHPSAASAGTCGTLGTATAQGATWVTCTDGALSTIHTPYNHH